MITRRQWLYFALILIIHRTILDMFLVTPSGPKVLWQDSLQWVTLAVHCSIVAFSCVILWCLYKLKDRFINQNKSA